MSLSLLLAGFLAACAGGGGDEAPKDEIPPEDSYKSALDCGPLQGPACEVLQDVNFQRMKNRVAALKISLRCQEVAEAHAKEMARKGFFSHESPSQGDFFQRAERFGLLGSAGENLAYRHEPSTVVNAWMNSASHRANLLNPRFQSTGIAVVPDSRNFFYYVQCFSDEPGI